MMLKVYINLGELKLKIFLISRMTIQTTKAINWNKITALPQQLWKQQIVL
jgi:hypothetical protein